MQVDFVCDLSNVMSEPGVSPEKPMPHLENYQKLHTTSPAPSLSTGNLRVANQPNEPKFTSSYSYKPSWLVAVVAAVAAFCSLPCTSDSFPDHHWHTIPRCHDANNGM
jgi:hypothetical protein